MSWDETAGCGSSRQTAQVVSDSVAVVEALTGQFGTRFTVDRGWEFDDDPFMAEQTKEGQGGDRQGTGGAHAGTYAGALNARRRHRPR